MLPPNHKRTTSSLAPPIFYAMKNMAIKRYIRFPINCVFTYKCDYHFQYCVSKKIEYLFMNFLLKFRAILGSNVYGRGGQSAARGPHAALSKIFCGPCVKFWMHTSAIYDVFMLKIPEIYINFHLHERKNKAKIFFAARNTIFQLNLAHQKKSLATPGVGV